MSDVPARLGVVGAGTMGAGVASSAAWRGMDTFLHDPLPGALERGADAVRVGLETGTRRGRWSEADASAAADRLRSCGALEQLAPCELVIEAAPERLELKRELFARLSEVCDGETVLATNTSSIPVAALATIDGLWEERREERYRAAPLLRRAVATETGLG